MTELRRPAARYPGGKWRVAPWIIAHIPRGHAHYVEPYGGAASVLLRKARSFSETYNDLDRGAVTFFRVLRTRPDELIRQLELTPYALEEYDLARQDLPDDLDDVERARLFYVRAMQGRSAASARYRSGWRRWSSPAGNRPHARTWAELDHLWSVAGRLQGVQIDCTPALQCIERYDKPETLFYCDPPYPMATRSQQWGQAFYRHEMTDQDHRDLAELLHEIRGMALISSYPSELYDDLYSDWTAHATTTHVQSNTPRTEMLWISPAALEALRAASRQAQLPLPARGEDLIPEVQP